MTGVAYETGSPSFERRIGTRVPIYGLDITWVESRPDTSHGHRPLRGWVGQIEEVSVTGAVIRGPAGLLVGPEGEAVVRFRDEDNKVVVHRSEPTETSGILRYGVEFVETGPGLKAQIYEVVAPEHENPMRWDLSTT